MSKILIGLDKFYYALLNTDTTAGCSYGTPASIQGAVGLKTNPNSKVETIFADDGPYDTAEAIGNIELDMEIADTDQVTYAALCGHTITGGVLYEKSSDQPPNVALGFRAKRSNGGYSYYWFLKGKFAKPAIDHKTKADKIDFQTLTMKGQFVQRVYDGKYKASTRDDATDYVAATGANWFSAVYGVTADTTAPTYLSSVPSAGSTAQSQTATSIAITFSEAIASSSCTIANFGVVAATSGASVPLTSVTQSTGGETLTLNYLNGSASLTAASTYDVLITTGVKDTAGNAMSAAYTFKFTTT